MATRKEEDLAARANGHALRSMTRPRVFILSNIRLMREGLTLALSRQPGIDVVGSSDTETLHEVAECAPDVLLLDVSNAATLECSTSLRRALPDKKIVALGVAEVEPVVLACAKAGVSGFVYSQGSAHDVAMVVHAAVRGELVCSARTAGMLLDGITSLNEAAHGGSGDALTAREQECWPSSTTVSRTSRSRAASAYATRP